jgi:hypothetical protein
MAVPKASMYQYHRLISAQGDVWTAGQTSSMKPEPVACCVQPSAHDQLRARVGSADSGHVGAALRRTQAVDHYPAM